MLRCMDEDKELPPAEGMIELAHRPCQDPHLSMWKVRMAASGDFFAI